MLKQEAVVHIEVSNNLSVGTEEKRDNLSRNNLFLHWHSNARTNGYEAELLNTEP